MTDLQRVGGRFGKRDLFARVRDVPAFREGKVPVRMRYEHENNQ